MRRTSLSCVVSSLSCIFAAAARWQLEHNVPKTAFNGAADGLGWQPMPTPGPVLIPKRQASGHNTCGYLDGDLANSLTCLNQTDTCVSNTALGAIGCCSTASVGLSSVTYTQCIYHTSCLNFLEMTSASGNPLVRTCPSDNPNCQTIFYFAGTESELFTDFICGSVSSTYALQQSPVAFPTSLNVDPSLTSSSFTALPTTSQVGPTSIPVTSSSTSHGLSAGTIAGIVIGTVALTTFFLSCFGLCWVRQRRVKRRSVLEISEDLPTLEKIEPKIHGGAKQDPRIMEIITESDNVEKGNSFEFICGPGRHLHGFSMTLPTPHRLVLLQFESFLSIYGHDGVPMRELLMLGALRYANEQSSSTGPHLSRSRAPGYRDTGLGSFLQELVLWALREGSQDVLERSLTVCGLIEVSGKGRSPGSEDTAWAIDTRIWYRGSSAPRFSPLKDQAPLSGDFRTLLQPNMISIFDRMPDKTSHPLAERHREIYYYHARALLLYVMSQSDSRELISNMDVREDFLHILLKVLTHRYQQGDMLLLDTARDFLPKSASHTYEWVLLKLAELKCLTHLRRSRSLRRLEKAKLVNLMTQMEEFLEMSRTTYRFGPPADMEARDIAGFFLIEIMDLGQSLQDHELIRASSGAAFAWVQETLSLVDSSNHAFLKRIELSPLSSMLVKLKKWEHINLNVAPKEFAFSYGYYSSRVGCLDHAERLLTVDHGEWEMRHWRYRHELVTVYLRQGRWSDAENLVAAMSKRLKESLLMETAETPESLFRWKMTGDPGEMMLTNACIMADCCAATGRCTEAEGHLEKALDSVRNMRDHFLRTTRVAIELRLLNVQLRLALPVTIIHTCELLWSEIQHPKTFPLEPEVAESIFQELLACVNTLRSAGYLARAYRILENMLSVGPEALDSQFEGSHAYMERLKADLVTDLDWERGTEHLKADPITDPDWEREIVPQKVPPRSLAKVASAVNPWKDEILPTRTPLTFEALGKNARGASPAARSNMTGSTLAHTDASTSSGLSSPTIIPRQPSQITAISSKMASQGSNNSQGWRPRFTRRKALEKERNPSSVQNIRNIRRLNALASPPNDNPPTAMEEKESKTADAEEPQDRSESVAIPA